MARISEVTVSLGRTIQVAPYQPLNYHLSYKVELSEGDNEEYEIAAARTKLEKQVNNYIESFNKEEPSQIKGTNRPSNNEPATPEQKAELIAWTNKMIPFEEKEEKIKTINGMSKAQALDALKHTRSHPAPDNLLTK